MAWVVSGVVSGGLPLALRGLVAKPSWLWLLARSLVAAYVDKRMKRG